MKRLFPARLQAALAGEGASRTEPSPERLRESRRRIRRAALLGALAYGLFLAVLVTGFEPSSGLEHSIDLRHDLLGVTLCGALFLIAALPLASDRLVLSFALAFEFLLSAVISTHAPWAAFVRTGHVSALTWLVPIVILFALLIPLPARTLFFASLACIGTAPLGLALLASRGAIAIRPADLWNSVITGGVTLGIATLAARTLHGAQREADAARMVGSYELLERIGQGGMGEVWKARHQMLARPSAVKRILAENLQGPREERDAAIQRFTREAQVTASLRSPHTVELFDFGVSADGSLYYAMEMLDGFNLEHFIYRFGPAEPRRAVHWLRQACHSLAEAHARQLVHRDIKPANLFICRYGRDADFLKVLDFGLTRPLDGGAAPNLTRTGTLVGTPSYMAPEQIFGQPSGPATDLYALGCVGYFVLAGVKPFEAAAAGEMLRQHAQSPPPPLATRATQSIPPRLEAAIMRCLSKDPAERPQDAESLNRELEQSVDGPPWSAEDACEWWDEKIGGATPAAPLSAPGGTSTTRPAST